METWQLETVLAVARCKNFTKAADELCLTPSALSVEVSQLEKELGVRLFVRGASSVRLTPAGRELVKRAADSPALPRETGGVMRQVAAAGCEHIAVGIHGEQGGKGMAVLLAGFAKQYPDVIVSLLESTGDSLLKLLESGEIDIAVCAVQPAASGQASDIEFVQFAATGNGTACLAIPRRPYLSRAVQSFRRFALKQA